MSLAKNFLKMLEDKIEAPNAFNSKEIDQEELNNAFDELEFEDEHGEIDEEEPHEIYNDEGGYN